MSSSFGWCRLSSRVRVVADIYFWFMDKMVADRVGHWRGQGIQPGKECGAFPFSTLKSHGLIWLWFFVNRRVRPNAAELPGAKQ